MVLKQAIEPVRNPALPGHYCPQFTVPKWTDGFRPVLDLSLLNLFLAVSGSRWRHPDPSASHFVQATW